VKRLLAVFAYAVSACAVAAAFSPAARGEVRPLLASIGIIACSGSSPCQEGKNSGTGAGLEGISGKGKGVIGQTNFNSTSSANGQAGVSGIDNSTTGNSDAGVLGTSTRGPGVKGVTTNGSGVLGSSTNVFGVYGSSTNGIGVLGNGPIAIIGATTTSTGVGVEGQGNGANSVGVEAQSGGGEIFKGVDHTGTGVLDILDDGSIVTDGELSVKFGAVLGSDVTTPATVNAGTDGRGAGVNAFGAEAVIGQGGNASNLAAILAVGEGGAVIAGNNSLNVTTFRADDNGDLHIGGVLFTAGSCATGCIQDPRAPGVRVISYAPREAAPTMEDFGEGQIVNGQGYIALDPAFANVIDQHSDYLVFITPYGDNRGLYVAQRSLAGFAVRESQGGHSTLGFSYRIVAKPYGSNEVRLPMQALPHIEALRPRQARP